MAANCRGVTGVSRRDLLLFGRDCCLDKANFHRLEGRAAWRVETESRSGRKPSEALCQEDTSGIERSQHIGSDCDRVIKGWEVFLDLTCIIHTSLPLSPTRYYLDPIQLVSSSLIPLRVRLFIHFLSFTIIHIHVISSFL